MHKCIDSGVYANTALLTDLLLVGLGRTGATWVDPIQHPESLTERDIRKVFGGKIAYGQYDAPLDNRVIELIDELHFTIWLGGTHTYAPYSIELMKMVASWQIGFAKDAIEKLIAGSDGNFVG